MLTWPIVDIRGWQIGAKTLLYFCLDVLLLNAFQHFTNKI